MPFDGVGFQVQRPFQRLGGSLQRLLTAGYDAIGPTIHSRLVPHDRSAVVSADEVVVLLRTARALIEPQHKWIRGHYRRFYGRYCAVGALRRAARRLECGVTNRAHDLLLDVARKHGFESVERMNDYTSHAFVLAAFDIAIANAAG